MNKSVLKYCTISLLLSSARGLDISIGNNQSRRQALSTIASTSLLTLPQPSLATTTGGTSIKVPSVNLSTPSSLPSKPFQLASFGLQIYDNEAAYRLTTTALEAGYRNFFASVLAGNQKGFAQAIRDSNIPRDELYICGSVLSNRARDYKDAYAKTQKGCLENLNVMDKNSNGKIDYLDMIMLDYPCLDDEGIRGQWDSFAAFLEEKHVVHLAVSNFSPSQLDVCIERGGGVVVPTVNQLPYSIANHPRGLLAENIKRNVHVQSWSPLSSTLPRYKDVMAEVGKKYEKSAAQVGLRWIVQNGGSYCVQSQKEKHFVEDLNVFDFELSQKDMDLLSDLHPPVAFS
jgi:diketogulonate reductase-like aldo/keto reductase